MPIGPPHVPAQRLKMPRNLSVKAETICNIIGTYGAVDFADALSDFIARVLNDIPGRATQYRSENIYLPFSRVPIYHSMKFTKSSNPNKLEIADAVHARPEHRDLRGHIIPSRFDTVLVKGREQTGQRSKGMISIQVLL